jgi:predicted nuclease of predicted toxin-antitoxin system
LIDANDHDIFVFARNNEFDAIVTIDDDFVRLLHLFSTPPKVIWIRTGNCATSVLADLLLSKAQSISEFLGSEEYVLYEVFKPV